jgi:hypothetical protein
MQVMEIANNFEIYHGQETNVLDLYYIFRKI